MLSLGECSVWAATGHYFGLCVCSGLRTLRVEDDIKLGHDRVPSCVAFPALLLMPGSASSLPLQPRGDYLCMRMGNAGLHRTHIKLMTLDRKQEQQTANSAVSLSQFSWGHSSTPTEFSLLHFNSCFYFLALTIFKILLIHYRYVSLLPKFHRSVFLFKDPF